MYEELHFMTSEENKFSLPSLANINLYILSRYLANNEFSFEKKTKNF